MGHASCGRESPRGGRRARFLTERGASFGYNNLVVDMRSLAIMREFAPVVFDATHSVQLPSAAHQGDGRPAVSGGQPEFIPLLSRAAVAAGVDGVFMEVHDNPAQAKSDGANALDLKLLPEVLDQLIAVQNALHTTMNGASCSSPERVEGSAVHALEMSLAKDRSL